MSATRSNWNAQSLPVRCHPISCLLLLPLGANEFPLSSPVLPNGPQGAGQRGQTKVQHSQCWCLVWQEDSVSSLRRSMLRCSCALLQDMGSCSPLPHAPSRGWYSADVHGTSGREPCLLPGASSAALSSRWSQYLCPALEVLWKRLPCCAEYWMGCAAASPGAHAAFPFHLVSCMQAGIAMLFSGATTTDPLPGRVLAKGG